MDQPCPDCQASERVQPATLQPPVRCPRCGRPLRIQTVLSQPAGEDRVSALTEILEKEAREAEDAAVRLALDRKWAQKLMEEKDFFARDDREALLAPVRFALVIAWPLCSIALFFVVGSARRVGLGEALFVAGLFGFFFACLTTFALWFSFGMLFAVRRWMYAKRRPKRSKTERTSVVGGRNVAAPSNSVAASATAVALLDRLDADARRILRLAAAEANSRHHDFVGTDHVLLAVLRQRALVPDLNRLIASPDSALTALQESLRQASCGDSDKPWLTPAVQRSLWFAVEEATQLGAMKVKPEHLLLGLLCERDSQSGAVLAAIDLDLVTARRLLRQLPVARAVPAMELSEESVQDLLALIGPRICVPPDTRISASSFP